MADVESATSDHRVTLDYRRFSSVALAATIETVLQRLPAEPAYALFYGPNDLWFGRVDTGGQVIVRPRRGASEAARPLGVDEIAAVFEARVFCDHWELRWLKADGLEGDGVLLVDEVSVPDGFGAPVVPFPRAVIAWDNAYLLWGEPVPGGRRDGWGLLATARIGKLWVPWDDFADDDRVQLTSREYVDDLHPHFAAPGSADHGNRGVIDERLIRFRRMPRRRSDNHG